MFANRWVGGRGGCVVEGPFLVKGFKIGTCFSVGSLKPPLPNVRNSDGTLFDEGHRSDITILGKVQLIAFCLVEKACSTRSPTATSTTITDSSYYYVYYLYLY
jgi:hypothetical protein